MKNDLRNKYLSRPRYNRYLIATSNNTLRAKKLYNANIRLAQAFHPLLSQFEVVLRNALNLNLSSFFKDPDWILTQKNGFMKNQSLAGSKFFLKTSVHNSEQKLIRRKIPITSGKIISDQTFGFWLAIFLPHHYALIAGQPIHVFSNKPSTEDRASIYSKLNKIKNFRNRVNHCEPLCFRGHIIDCNEALEIRNHLYDLVGWIDPQLIPFFESVDNILNKINHIQRI